MPSCVNSLRHILLSCVRHNNIGAVGACAALLTPYEATRRNMESARRSLLRGERRLRGHGRSRGASHQERSGKVFDSDTVSCVANLAHLKTTEMQAIDFTLVGDPFNEQLQVDRLLQFIRVEKPYFKGIIVPDHLRTVLCVKPKQSNQRIRLKPGLFFCLAWPLTSMVIRFRESLSKGLGSMPRRRERSCGNSTECRLRKHDVPRN